MKAKVDTINKEARDILKQEGDLFKGVLGKGINMGKAIKKMKSVFTISKKEKRGSSLAA